VGASPVGVTAILDMSDVSESDLDELVSRMDSAKSCLA
jgi:hypothetical protein